MDLIDREIAECAAMSDEQLTAALAEAVKNERTALISLLVRLGEFYNRDLSLKRGYQSPFDYCTRVLGYSRGAAGRRIAAAKAARQYRSILNLLAKGEITLTAIAMLARFLTPENHWNLLRRASRKSEDEIDRMIAELAPRTAPKDRIRAIGNGAPTIPDPAVSPSSVPESSSSIGDLFGLPDNSARESKQIELYSVSFAATKETRQMLERAKELLRHRCPEGKLDDIIKLALSKLLAEIDRDLRTPSKRAGRRSKGGSKGRYIPEAVKQKVWKRDGGCCSFVASDGTRCNARADLQFDHKRAFAMGGSSRDPRNLRVFCGPHNRLVGRATFGGPFRGAGARSN